jgi:hypothetical protein
LATATPSSSTNALNPDFDQFVDLVGVRGVDLQVRCWGRRNLCTKSIS